MASLAALILSHTLETLSDIRFTAVEQISFNHENNLPQIPVIVVLRVSKIAGKSIQKSENIFSSTSIRIDVILFRFSKAHSQFHEKILLKKSITSLKIAVTHLTVSAIAWKLDLTNSTTNNKTNHTTSLNTFQIGISIGSN